MFSRQGAARPLLTIVGFLALTALMTAPLAWRGARSGPVNTGDGQWSIWSTSWVARALIADPLHVYDANIFAPHRRTLAYSEPNLVGGLLAAPAWWATRNPYLAYSTAVFLSFLLAALATFALVRALTGHAAAAAVAAAAFAFAPFVIVRLAHVQLLMTLGLPLALLAMHRLVDRQSPGRVAALAIALVIAALCSGYYGLFAALAVGLGLVYYALTRGLWRKPRYLAAAASAIVLAGLLVLPFFLPYLDLERGGQAFRTLEESRRYSADWRSYLTSTSHAHRWLIGLALPFDRSAFPERVLFPGFVTLALAAVAVAGAFCPTRQPQPRAIGLEPVGFYSLLALVSAWLSLGPQAGLYTLFYHLAPGFSLLRAPSRFGALVALSLAVLAGIGLAWLARGRRGALVCGAAGLLLVGELIAAPLDLRNALPEPRAYRLLASLPAGAVAEFPFYFLERDFHRNTLYMLHSTRHWHPLVNGYSDFIPGGYRETVVAISTFPSREAFRLLRERGTRFVVLHTDLYDHRSVPKLVDAIDRYKEYLRPLATDGDVWLYEVVAWP